MMMKLEVAVLPVSDIDRAKHFYKTLGWREDADFDLPTFRVIQMTPPGSQASIIFGSPVRAEGSERGLHMLVVEDIEGARKGLVENGVDVSEVFHDAGGVFHHNGDPIQEPGRSPEGGSYGSFVTFSDPDGNDWVVQEVTTRLPGRVAGPAYDSTQALIDALRRAEAAHGEFEAKLGHRHEDWAPWYAQFMTDEQAS
jgi:catechol 2,3-dioxygenase-like lactoylglutathione lyase family enzyme